MLIKIFRVMALLEALSWFALLFTMYLKYAASMPEPNKVVGMAHGLLFLGYVALAFQVSAQRAWSLRELIIAQLCSLVPGGTIYVERKMLG
jgi:integral membrane protein